MGVEFLVLGPIEARRDGDAVPLGGPQQRRLLAILLSASGQVLSLDRLEETLWPSGDAPEGARRTLFTYVSRLRSALGDGHVVTRDSGYLFDTGAEPVDWVVFEGLVSTARTAAPTLRVALLDQALALWRGPAFGEFGGEWWARPTSARLEELRLVANEDRIDALLELGDADRAVSEAEGFVAAYPLRERPVAQLMRARLVTGRQAEALRAFQEFRAYLAEKTGLDPSPALIELERSIAAGVAPESPSTTRVARGYVLGDVLGQGSFGTVFRATQPGVGREVAVKVIRSELANNPSFVQRFEAEAQLVARLEHPHIVPLYDFWREPGGAYLVFRLLRGGSAEQSLAIDGPWSLDRVSRLVEQIGGALSVAHAAGVIHRDIKPANVLFDDSGNAHLADFGIAATDDSADVGGMYSAGSPLYASPEQFQHMGVSARSDLYSFGAMVWELLAGVPPFDGDSATMIGRVKLERPVPSLIQWRPDLAPTIDAVLQKATAVNSADRFASAIDLVLAWRAAVEARQSATTDDGLARARSTRQHAAQTMTELTIAGANPYKGLRPFAEADARDYFGRTVLVEDLVRAVSSSRVTMVVGSSGSGKSSLLHAGLLPRLRSSGARVVTMVPTDRPCAQLHTALLSAAVEPLAPKVEHAVEFVADESPNELVIVVDQFEEVWTLTSDADERDRFVTLLRRLAVDDSINVRLVFAIRADFFDRPLSDPELGSIVAKNAFSIAPMTAAELSAAVRAPANAAGVTFEPGLDAEIVADVVNQSASLPLLQFALAELYEHRRGAVIPTAAYREMGGVAGAVASRAEGLYGRLDDAGQRETRRLFSRLVTPGAGAEDTRRRARRSELPESANAIADQFVTHRLLVVDRDPATREPTIDIAHEALLTRWPRLRGWLDEDREQLQLMQHLSRAADEWVEAGRRDTDLYRGPRLSIVGEINDAGNAILAPVEDEFLTASRAARDAEQQQERQRVAQQARQNSRLRRSLVAAGALLIIALIAGSVALAQRNRADDQRASAEAARDDADIQRVLAQSRAEDATAARDQATAARDQAEAASREADIARLVAQSQSDSRLSPTRALLLAVEAYNREQSSRTAGAMQTAIAAVPKGTLAYLEGEGAFGGVKYGKSVIVGNDGEAIGIWSATTYRRLGEIRDPAITQGPISLSSDDRYVAASGSHGFTIFDVGTRTAVARVATATAATAVAFDPQDADRILIGQLDGSLGVVRWRTGQSEARYAQQSDRVMSVSFSGDGGLLSASTYAGSAQVFDTRSGAAIGHPVLFERRLLGAPNIVLARLSRSGRYLIATGISATKITVQRVADAAIVFEYTNPAPPSFPLHADLIEDTNTLVIAQNTGELLFDLDTKQPLPRTSLPSSLIYIDVAISPDTKSMAVSTASEISIRALDARQLGAETSFAQPPGFSASPPTSLSFNEGRTTLLLSGGSTSYLYDLTTTPAAVREVGFAGPGQLVHARFAGRGHFIETLHTSNATGLSTYQQWDPATLRATAMVTLPGALFDKRAGIASSPDGRFVAAGNVFDALVPGGKPTVRVFDVQTGALRWSLTDLDDIVTGTLPGGYLVPFAIAFSPDSRFVAATSSSPGALAVWDLATGRATPVATTGAGTIAYASNGDLLLIGTNYHIGILDGASLTTRFELAGRAGASIHGAFHPSKSLLLTENGCGKAVDDGAGWGLQLWDLERRVEIGVGLNLWCAAWSPDGERFGATDNRTIQIWSNDWAQWKRAACAAAGRNLTDDEWRTYVSDTALRRDTCV